MKIQTHFLGSRIQRRVFDKLEKKFSGRGCKPLNVLLHGKKSGERVMRYRRRITAIPMKIGLDIDDVKMKNTYSERDRREIS